MQCCLHVIVCAIRLEMPSKCAKCTSSHHRSTNYKISAIFLPLEMCPHTPHTTTQGVHTRTKIAKCAVRFRSARISRSHFACKQKRAWLCACVCVFERERRLRRSLRHACPSAKTFDVRKSCAVDVPTLPIKSDMFLLMIDFDIVICYWWINSISQIAISRYL